MASMASGSSDDISCGDEQENSDSPSDTDTSTSSNDESSDPRGHRLQRKRKVTRKNYFQGQARYPYSLGKRLDESCKDMDEESPSVEGVCVVIVVQHLQKLLKSSID